MCIAVLGCVMVAVCVFWFWVCRFGCNCGLWVVVFGVCGLVGSRFVAEWLVSDFALLLVVL